MDQLAGRARVKRIVNSALASVGLQLETTMALNALSWNDAPVIGPAGAAVVDPDRVLDLTRRFEGHPAAQHSVWSSDFPIRYALTTAYARAHDPLCLMDLLTEDGLYGAHVVDIDGRLVSRDLLDSVVELNFLDEQLGLNGISSVLDIGAGYGRLAHRLKQVLPGIDYVATDAVPLSTVICETYLASHGCDARVVPLDEIQAAVLARPPELAVNIHSFSETTLASIRWWLSLIASAGVPYLMVVPNDGSRTHERDGSRVDFLPSVLGAGYRLRTRRPKYAHSAAAQRFGIFPTEHLLFEREGA